MDTANMNTLQQATNAIGQVQTALQDPTLSPANRTALEDTLVALRGVQNDIISNSAQALVDALKGDNDQLSQLADQINAGAAQLDQVAATIKSVSNTVGTLINVTTAAVSAGII
jgi:hypothetical protein